MPCSSAASALFRLERHPSWLAQVSPLSLKAFEGVLVLPQVVKLGLRQCRLKQVRLVLAHVKATWIETILVDGTLAHANRWRKLLLQEHILVDVRKEGVVQDLFVAVCTESCSAVFIEQLEDDVHEVVTIVDFVLTLVGEDHARLADLH